MDNSTQNQLHVKPEILLDALNFANEFTFRNLRGLISEYYLRQRLIKNGFVLLPTEQNDPFDFKIEKNNKIFTIQLKLQRQSAGQPIFTQDISKKLPAGFYVSEIQRCRNGFDRKGFSTRPYKFTDFDILAVCLEPVTKDWHDFTFCLTSNLLADPKHPSNIFKYQAIELNQCWNREIEECIKLI